jgi:hypothetical protein
MNPFIYSLIVQNMKDMHPGGKRGLEEKREACVIFSQGPSL